MKVKPIFQHSAVFWGFEVYFISECYCQMINGTQIINSYSLCSVLNNSIVISVEKNETNILAWKENNKKNCVRIFPSSSVCQTSMSPNWIYLVCSIYIWLHIHIRVYGTRDIQEFFNTMRYQKKNEAKWMGVILLYTYKRWGSLEEWDFRLQGLSLKIFVFTFFF